MIVLGFDFDRLRSGPFEGPAIVKPPALPGILTKSDPRTLGGLSIECGKQSMVSIPISVRVGSVFLVILSC